MLNIVRSLQALLHLNDLQCRSLVYWVLIGCKWIESNCVHAESYAINIFVYKENAIPSNSVLSIDNMCYCYVNRHKQKVLGMQKKKRSSAVIGLCYNENVDKNKFNAQLNIKMLKGWFVW